MKLRILAIAALLIAIDSAVTRFPGLAQTKVRVQIPLAEPDFYH
ncbi:MAG TPA: hypothetical protein V6C90_02795 [Coleofasciculaceae cyanobacterium]|jgi:hypothetical protein